jgi:hypothetical protein
MEIIYIMQEEPIMKKTEIVTTHNCYKVVLKENNRQKVDDKNGEFEEDYYVDIMN